MNLELLLQAMRLGLPCFYSNEYQNIFRDDESPTGFSYLSIMDGRAKSVLPNDVHNCFVKGFPERMSDFNGNVQTLKKWTQARTKSVMWGAGAMFDHGIVVFVSKFPKKIKSKNESLNGKDEYAVRLPCGRVLSCTKDDITLIQGGESIEF